MEDKHKRFGIEPDKFETKNLVEAMSNNINADDLEYEYDPNIPCYDCVIISESDCLHWLSECLFVFMCLCSSHFAFCQALVGDESFYIVSWAIEAYFLLHLCQGFITEYQPVGKEPVREISQIATQFVVYGSFWWEMIAVLPL